MLQTSEAKTSDADTEAKVDLAGGLLVLYGSMGGTASLAAHSLAESGEQDWC